MALRNFPGGGPSPLRRSPCRYNTRVTLSRPKPGPAVPPAPPEDGLDARTARAAFSGFFLTGLLMSLLGAILPAWGYTLRSDFASAGIHFLAMAVGILLSVSISNRIVPRKGASFALALGSGIACGALLYLAAVSPPVASGWRSVGLFCLGVASGMLLNGLFHAVSPIYRHNPAATVNIAGALFVLGSLTAALLVAGAFYVYTVGSTVVLIAVIPGMFSLAFSRRTFPRRASRPEMNWRAALEDFRSPSAVLFALLLFVQSGNEWSLAGWLAIFLIHRIGASPEAALFLLALYWFSLLAGRVGAQALLPRVAHARMLAPSVLAAMFGCLILSFTNNLFGAVLGVLSVGGGFATIYPLVVEKIGIRFPYFHPTLFNGIFSLAMAAGLLAPWVLGLAADRWGIRVTMLLPLGGTVVVFLLLVLIWFEARLSGRVSAT